MDGFFRGIHHLGINRIDAFSSTGTVKPEIHVMSPPLEGERILENIFHPRQKLCGRVSVHSEFLIMYIHLPLFANSCVKLSLSEVSLVLILLYEQTPSTG